MFQDVGGKAPSGMGKCEVVSNMDVLRNSLTLQSANNEKAGWVRDIEERYATSRCGELGQ